jgi:hypothetical protein
MYLLWPAKWLMLFLNWHFNYRVGLLYNKYGADEIVEVHRYVNGRPWIQKVILLILLYALGFQIISSHCYLLSIIIHNLGTLIW